jgi:hypothetical protein
MRLYTFINYYLSSIQQGIQSAHIAVDLFCKYTDPKYDKKILDTIITWADDHKTMVVCNGGNVASLKDLIQFFKDEENIYPWASFCEDGDSLGGTLTGVGIIIPEELYDVTTEFEYNKKTGIRSKQYVYAKDIRVTYADPESYIYQFIDRIKSAPLAK